MRRHTRKVVVTAGIAALGATLAACGGGGSTSSGSGSGGAQHKGGTLVYSSLRDYEHTDPQREYLGVGIMVWNRMTSRTLTAFPAKEGAAAAKLVPDAATDTGKASNGNKTWSFTLRSGMKWQDGKPVTCEDFKYGISRTFGTNVIGNTGPQYAIAYLDIPKNSDGTSKYKGPYSGKGQALYDKAVVCDGNTITFHLNKPIPDFNQTVTMTAFAAVRKDKDTGAKYDNTPFSDGPYMLQGKWQDTSGGTFVRNPHWDPKTDPNIRKAYPDKIQIKVGDTAETISQQLISDSGDAKNMTTWTSVPSSMIAQALNNPNVKSRSKNVLNPFTDYLSINVKQIPNVKVRQALAMAIDKTAYVTAQGGSTSGVPADGGVINPGLPQAYAKYDPFGVGVKGNPAKAKAMLKSAGVKTPYPITYTYNTSPTQDKVAANIQSELNAVGFKVKLKPLKNTYYDVIQNANTTTQLVWAGWGADWPSGSTVIQPLFDGRVNISGNNLGSDYAQWNDPAFNKKIDQAFRAKSNAQAQQQWKALDQEVVKQAVVVPMMYDKWFFIHGSNVKGFVLNPSYGSYPDLATISVK